MYTVTLPEAGNYEVTVQWGTSSWADKSYVQCDTQGSTGSYIMLATDSNDNQEMTSSSKWLSAGSHSLYIGSASDGNYYTQPWCGITIAKAGSMPTIDVTSSIDHNRPTDRPMLNTRV